MTILETWNSVQQSIKEKIGASSYESWFTNLHAQADQDTLNIITPDDFFKTWIVDNYLNIIRDSLSEAGQELCTVSVSVGNDPVGPALALPKVTTTLQTIPTQTMFAPESRSLAVRGQSSNIQKRFTFDTFVMGSSNRMAFRASQAVAENPAKAYNPLFIYGQSGMGKTHLMQAICNGISSRSEKMKTLYVTSEQFTNELIEAIKNRSAHNFKHKYRNIDVLLIDDIQFIAGKESTQEEFFHTFNDLHNAHKQIILSCDRPAKEVSRLEDRLVTRFVWGLTVDIQPPDFETRIAILKKKIELAGLPVPVPEDVIYFIGEQIKTNIRELEGALMRVVASSQLEESPVTLDLAQNILKDMVKESTKTISLEMILQTAGEYYKLNISELKSNRRTQTIVVPRQISMYLARKLTKHSLPEIGNAFGGRDHTTVLHSCKKIEADLNSNQQIRYAVEKLTEILKR